MNREQIIQMAREANRYADTHADSTDCDWPLIRDEHFAALVVAAEREACAKVCEGRIGGAVQTNEWWNGFRSAMKQCAAAIRARDKT